VVFAALSIGVEILTEGLGPVLNTAINDLVECNRMRSKIGWGHIMSINGVFYGHEIEVWLLMQINLIPG
jgi:hypothetical protein